jgi:hypothetical protein
MEEIWKDVVGYEGFYLVSNLGRIKRYRASKKNKQEKILFQTITHHGYRRTVLQKMGHVKNFFVHRVVAEAFIGVGPEKMEVNHINSIRHDNRPENLEYVTRSTNECLVFIGKKRGVQKYNHGYQAKIWFGGVHRCIGTYRNEDDAYEAYKKEYIKLRGFSPW